jgi:hypothetical protein
MRRPLARLLVVALLTLTSCGPAPEAAPPADYEHFQPKRGQWVLSLEGIIDASQTDALRSAVEEVPGVVKGSARLSIEGRYLAFTTEKAYLSDAGKNGKVAGDVRKKLAEHGVKVPFWKTDLP